MSCQLFEGTRNRGGYGQVRLGRMVGAHRLAYALHYGVDPGELHVLHRCDRPACVNPEHLFLGTHQDNMRDRAAKRRGNRGERHTLAKISFPIATEIREAAARGETRRSIGARFGIDQSTVTRIVHFRTWRMP